MGEGSADTPTKPRILAIAGSDSGAGAGIQADLKTAMALGAYATTAITAVTAQDTRGVHAIHPIPTTIIRYQIDLALADIGADAVKTGMLGTAETIETVAAALSGRNLPLVLDPVMVAKGGAALLDPAALAALLAFLPQATLLTPNIPEAETLLHRPIPDLAAAKAAARDLLALGPQAILLKGGHADGDTVRDILATSNGSEILEMPRIHTSHTHGTGCTLATAIATGLAQRMTLSHAVHRARAYVQAAIAAAPNLGAGHGPLEHAVRTLTPVWS